MLQLIFSGILPLVASSSLIRGRVDLAKLFFQFYRFSDWGWRWRFSNRLEACDETQGAIVVVLPPSSDWLQIHAVIEVSFWMTENLGLEYFQLAFRYAIDILDFQAPDSGEMNDLGLFRIPELWVKFVLDGCANVFLWYGDPDLCVENREIDYRVS